MANNSVPVFFGGKARTKKPVALDVTFISDRSGSMRAFVAFVTSVSTVKSLEQALLDQSVGVTQPNRYSICQGAGARGSTALRTLAQIEFPVVVSGVSQRWALGSDLLADKVLWPQFSADAGDNTEDVAGASYLVATGSRGYQAAAQRIIVAAGDLQSPYLEGFVSGPTTLAALTAPDTGQIYVGVHNLSITIAEPAGPNPIPAGQIFGFIFTTNTTGTAIYLNGATLNYRFDVPIANVTTTFSGSFGGYGPTSDQVTSVFNLPRQTNGAIYRLALSNTQAGTEALGVSLGQVLGEFLFDTKS